MEDLLLTLAASFELFHARLLRLRACARDLTSSRLQLCQRRGGPP